MCALIIYSSLLSWLTSDMLTRYYRHTLILITLAQWVIRIKHKPVQSTELLHQHCEEKKTKLNTQNAQQYTFFSVICTFSSPLQWNIDLSGNGLEKFVRYIRYLDLSLLVCLVFIFNLHMLTFFIRYIKVCFTICTSRLCLLRWGFC